MVKIVKPTPSRAQLRRIRRIRIILTTIVLLAVLCVVFLFILPNLPSKPTGGSVSGTEQDNSQIVSEEVSTEELLAQKKAEIIIAADKLAVTYNYDGAITLIQSIPDYTADEELKAKIIEYAAAKDSCVRVNIDEVTHIFYHSLVVDPERAFNPDKFQGRGNNEWMTTVSEFNKITQTMYDNGYVLVSIHDLYEITTDENGNEIMVEADIMLPPDKKAFVLSLDDLSYYHSYTGYGFASKLLLDENGKVINEYIDAEGNILYGAYDCVPLLDQFIEEHPDASYHGAKGTIALTGYNGILGYRTDESYRLDNDDLDSDKRKWLEDNPDFDLEKERAAAKEVADAMKANGWTFASHTWGHLNVGNKSLATLKTDNEKWQKNVASIVGETNVIVFAHGVDLEDWGDYSETNEKFNYYFSQGFNVFCNVDGSSPYLTRFCGNYLRQGRRNLDGIRFHYNLTGQQDNLSDLFNVEDVVDPLRPSLDIYN